MKKIFLLLLTAVSIACTAVKPAWIKQLERQSIIDSVVYVQDSAAADSNATLWHLYYHQPIAHTDSANEQFQLRCVLLIRNGNRPKKCVNEFYFRGYDIDRQWTNPTKYLGRKNYSEIAQRYHANLLMPEHRYFSASCPDSCWQHLEYLNAKEAAEDFHALLQALKTVFQGKWVITGISKGGITTAIQHAFHPEDADVFVPNCGPFCRTISDPRLFAYFEHNGWTPDMRARLDSFYCARIADTATQRIFPTLYRKTRPQASDYECRKAYLVNVMEMGFSLHSYTEQDKVDSVLSSWQGLPENTVAQKVLEVFEVPAVSDAVGATATSMTREQWEGDNNMAYLYQACRELGQYGYDFHYLYRNSADRALADSLQAFATQEETDYIAFQFPWLKNVPYDNYGLFSFVEQKTRQATKPIIFLYSTDDPWTGAQMGDEFINGRNVRKYILDKQTHGVSIDQDEKYRDEIWKFLDSIIK